MSIALDVWLKSFLERRRVASQRLPDGRLLFRYRCENSEFEALRQLLRERLRGRLDGAADSATAALFCLCAAEWWRRDYREGGWTWRGLLDAMGVGGEVPHAQLAQLTERGLRFWNRRVRERGGRQEYLLSLALEGGMPLRLVERPDTHVGRFLLRLIQEVRDFPEPNLPALELAQRSRHVLPTSLQNDTVLTLSAELAAGVVLLQRQVRGEEDPYQALDARVPDWRERLPLDLHHKTAEMLLRGLIQAAHEPVAGQGELKVTTRLLPWQQGYVLERAVSLPRRLSLSGLAHILKQAELPARLQLIALARDGTRLPLAMLTQLSDVEYLVETSHGTSVQLSGDTWIGPVLLSAWSSGQELGRHVLPRGEELGELPWLFVPDLQARAEGSWRLAGTGSGRFRVPELLVAVPKGAILTMRGPGAHWERLGPLVLEREVFRVHGGVEVVLADVGTCQVSTGAATDEAQHCRLETEPVELLPGVDGFLGVPALRVSFSTGVEQRRDKGELEYRSARTKTWQRVDGACLGDVHLRYVSGGALRFQTRALVLPSGASLQSHPEGARQGRLRIGGLGMAAVKVPPVPHVHADVQTLGTGSEVLLRCDGEAPDHVLLDVSWPGGQSCSLQVPFPRQLVGFTDTSARPLQDGTLVPLERLGRVRALVRTSQLQASAELDAAPGGTAHHLDPFFRLKVPLRSISPGTLELNLGELESALAKRLASFGGLDAFYELRLRVRGASDMRPAVLRVGRYDLRLTPDREASVVRLADDDLAGAAAPEALSVEFRPLIHPAAPERALERVGPRTWRVPADLAPGPWLVTGREGGWYRARPLLWSVRSGGEESGAPVLGPLQRAVCVSHPQRRKTELDAALEALGGDANHPDWPTLLTYLRSVGQLPPETFDAVRQLVDHPRTATLALFHLSEPDRGRVWVGLEELPFQWPLVPARAWLEAARAWLGSASAFTPELRASLELMLRERYEDVCRGAQSRFAGLEAVLQWVGKQLMPPAREGRRIVGRDPSLVRKRPGPAPAVAEPLRLALDDELRQLRRVHADVPWPSVSNYGSSFEAPLRRFSASAQRYIFAPLQGIAESLPLLNAPVLAALSVVYDQRLPAETQFALRTLRELHPSWFSFAFGYVASICLNEEK
ncbi:MAG TPA: STY4851/ECs_5259 family protein [Archangium sp.]|uniref:STY4851/ECs_5259 family protein n=1 Tax=Archangium sp. TaxID=1872627 RepID=UPI002E30919E|nr:STY4851/ECs_5259 family protein [Archangium sp.]HEX5745016.1 STY4851/ECs_5259 family protein [Archangium sp.]